jgi:hypothetical protein
MDPQAWAKVAFGARAAGFVDGSERLLSLGDPTFAGASGNAEDAPIPAGRGATTEPLESTQAV